MTRENTKMMSEKNRMYPVRDTATCASRSENGTRLPKSQVDKKKSNKDRKNTIPDETLKGTNTVSHLMSEFPSNFCVRSQIQMRTPIIATA